MFKKKILLLLLPLTFFINANAQIDTSFWFVAPDISQGLGDRPIYIYFNTYAQAANVTLSQPANGAFLPIVRSIPANSIDSINLTPFITSIENNTPNAVLNRGIYISSSQKISAMYSIRATANREYISLKGSKALGKDFYVPMQEFWNQTPATSPKSFSSFDIIASDNNTTVLITPRTAIIGHAANATFSVSLQKGETFSCQDTNRTATTSLAGSIISSNKPLAITIQSSGLNELGCLSSVTDQITSSDYAGTDYVVVRGKASTEKIFVLATQNNTQLTVNDGSVTTKVMNYGENYTYTAAQNITYIKTDKPVYLFHVSGYGCRLSGAQLPPLYCAGTFSTAFTRASSDSLYVNLFTRTGYEGNFALNGNASLVPASAFTVVPGTSGSVMAARILYNTATIPVGSHNVITNTSDVFGLGVLNGANAKGSSYAYASEFVSYPSINAGSNYTICANGSLVLNGQVGGGNVTGVWSTNGYGTFNAGTTVLTNTYTPSLLDSTVKPVRIVLSSTGQCPQLKDTLFLTVKQSPLVNASVDQVLCANNANALLNGGVTGGSSTGIWSTAGTGAFTPTNTALNATYIPSPLDISNGSVKLTLASTANGICSASKDSLLVTFTPPPVVNIAATTISVCANNPSVAISGTVTGITTSGKWTSTGTGNFNPSNIQLSTGYIPSAADILSGSVKLYLSSTSNGNCNPAKDSVTIVFTAPPMVNAGPNKTICKNNILTVLNGTVSGATTSGIWSGGMGTYSPSNTALTVTYTPTPGEISAGSVNLVLTSTGNGNCNAVSSNVNISFTNPPYVNAGADLSICKNNINTVLSGVVTGTTSTGVWSGGSGTYNPSATALTPTYTPTPAEIAAGSVSLTLTSTGNGNCNAVTDVMVINFTNPPAVNAGADLSVCKNNASATLNGSVTGITTTGYWTGGLGSYIPSNSVLNATYTPHSSELAAGSVTLTLVSSNNNNCNAVTDVMVINFTNPPVVSAGSNVSVCKNNMITPLNGSVTGPTSTGIWSGGTGTFTPNNTTLNANYQPSASELAAGSVNLVLTSTGNGNCSAVSSNVNISFTNPPYVNAGADLSICKNNNTTVLTGVVTGTTTTGVWGGGSGVFSPSSSVLNPTYTPTPAEMAAGSVTLTLTSTNNANCNAVTDAMVINFTNPPTVDAGTNLSACQNKAATPLNGTVTGVTTTGVWSGGAGSFSPSNSVLNGTYTPTPAELAAGSVTLTLTSSNNGNCNSVSDNLVISFTIPPAVSVGSDIYACKNNALTALSGTVSGATTTGIWSGGTGTFTPNNTTLNAGYQPSAADLATGLVNLVLTSTGNGNCNAVSSSINIFYTNPPYVNAGADLTVCRNNINTALSGVVSGITTSGVWSGGAGVFSPSASALNPTYTPTPAELASGSLTLTLASTGNANCNAVTDNVVINFINPPAVNAGLDLSSCKNNAATALSGSVSGITTTGVWSGGAGSYNPSNSVLNATYTPNSTELAIGSATLVLSSSNNGTCLQVKDTVVINFTAPPIANAGADVYACKNNASSVLTGSVSGATTTGIWSGGTGTFTPNNTTLNATYQPSAAELAAGFVNLVLTSTNNGGCVAVSDYMQMFFNNAPIVNAGVDMYACQNNAMPIIAGVITGTTSTGIWSGGNGTYSPSNTALTTTYTPTSAELAAGSVTLTLTSTNNGNCNAAADSLVVFFTNAPVVSAGLDISSCKNNPSSPLSGVVTGPTSTGIWTGGTGSFNPGSTVLTSTYMPSASEIATGSVTLVLSSTNNGTCAQSKDTLVITFINSPTTNAGIDLYSCKNNPLSILSGTVSGPTTTGVWSGGTGTFLPNNAALTATYVPSTAEVGAGFVNLTLTSTNNGNCNAVSDVVRINYMPKPFANFNFNNVCQNLATSFTDFSLPGAGAISAWEWSFGDGSPLDTNSTTTHIYPTSGTYTAQLVVKNSYGCSDTIRQTPTVYPLPVANFGMTKICLGTDLYVYFSDSSTVNSPEMVNQWFWDFGGPGQSNIHNPTQLYPGSGLYNITLIATTNHSCKDTIVKQINLLPRPIAGFAYSMTTGANVGTTVSFVDTSSYASTWTYNFGDGTSSNLQNPSTVYFDNGVFVVTQIVGDGYGCTDTARVAIKISNITTEISTLIPNAISPNGDGKNDVWKLEFLDLLYPNATVEIYNRWGQQIYTAYNGYKEPWDGTYKGEKLPVGTYYYILTLNDANNTAPFKGGILLVR